MTFPQFLENSSSLIKKHLTENLYTRLKNKKTKTGFTLDKAIRSGVRNPDSSIGIYAGDTETYDLFYPLLAPIIKEYHHRTNHEVDATAGTLYLEDPDPDGKYILSTRIRLARNLKGHCFPCHMALDERRAVEKKIRTAIKKLGKPFTGRYWSYEQIDKTTLNRLSDQKLAFERGDRFQESAGLNTDFPKCRGVFHSSDKALIIWVHEEDHMRIISMEKSSRLDRVYKKILQAMETLGQNLSFARHPDLGYLTSCPTNIGTTMRAGVHIRLKRLDQNRTRLEQIAQSYQLQIRGTAGEKTNVLGSVFDISNRSRLGISRSDIIKNLNSGLSEIIKLEKSI